MKRKQFYGCLVLVAAGCAVSTPDEQDPSILTSQDAITVGTAYTLTLPKMSGDKGNCVQVAGASLNNKANIQEWDCNGAAEQQLVAEAGPSPYYRFKNVNSGKCLSVYTGSIDPDHPVSGNANGASIQQETCGTSNQNYWELVSYNGGYQLKSKLLTGDGVRRCMDVTGGDTHTANGTQIELWSCGSSTKLKGNQTFNPVPIGNTGGGSGPVTAEELLAKVTTCAQLAGTTKFATDTGEPKTIPVCGLKGAVWWQADMDIDCDGKTTAQCNINTDPYYQNQTSATDSKGHPLDAAGLPFVVVPLPGNGFDYAKAGLELGSVVAVVYNGKLEYAVIGDEGPNNIIGEASYATAKALGIDPDPSIGGVDCMSDGTTCPVTYIAFTGSDAVASPIEDHAKAITVGDARARQLFQDNP